MITDSISILLALVLGGILLLCVSHFSYGWRGPSKSGARLPKGSFGFPIIGESIAFFTNPPGFGSSHIKRYGTVFKSSLFLQPTIVGTTPEFAKFVLTNNQLFGNGYHKSLTEVLGPRAFLFKDGPHHLTVKKRILKVIRPDALRTQVNVAESIILQNLASWEQQGTVNARISTQKLTLDTGMWFLIGAKDIRSTPEGRKALESFTVVGKAILSVPLNLPGSTYRKGLKAKADLVSFLKNTLQQRRAQQNPQNDVLGALLSGPAEAEALDGLKEIDDDDIADNLLALLFAAFDTTSTTLTWALKYLAEHPDVFSRVRAEHQEILNDKGPDTEGGPRLTWEDMKKMTYTSQFFQEIQRIVSVVPFVTRKASQDIEYEGHLIPKGWAVSPMLNSIHLDPASYPDPHAFNPDRFNVTPKSYTYLPFGSGTHNCPGVEIAKLVSFIFIHHIATTYTYESVGPDLGCEYTALANPVGGFPISVRRATKAD